jgi:hypothetical protein
MNQETLLEQEIPNILKRYKLHVKKDKFEEVSKTLSFYIYNLIINICTLIATITNIYSKSKKVESRFIKMSLNYVKTECYTMKGGSYVIDSQYFGQESNNYQENVSATTTEQIDFQNQIARNEIVVQQGGKYYESVFDEFKDLLMKEQKLEYFFGVNIKDIFKQLDIKVSDYMLKIIKSILKMHLNCFMHDLKKYKKITKEHIDKITLLPRHTVFT